MAVEVESNGIGIGEPVAAPKEAVDGSTELIKVKTVAASEHKEPEDDKEHTTLGSIMEKSSSFKEESYFLADIKDHEKKALMDLKSMLEDAVANNNNDGDLCAAAEEQEENKEGESEREISLWGVTLVPTTKSPESTNVVLLKFLRAREFKAREAFDMIRNTLRWRREWKVDSILDESSLGEESRGRSCCVGGCASWRRAFVSSSSSQGPPRRSFRLSTSRTRPGSRRRSCGSRRGRLFNCFRITVSYGRLKREGDVEFSRDGGAITEIIVKAGSTENVEIPLPQAETTLVWDLTVLGWQVNYKEEFVPFDEGSYTIVIQKPKKIGYQEETIRNSFKNSEPGKVVLAVENSSHKKKRVLFRSKAKKNCSE